MRLFSHAVMAALLLAAPMAALAQFSAQLSPPRFEEQANAGSVYGVSSDWTETGIKWSNDPAMSGSPVRPM